MHRSFPANIEVTFDPKEDPPLSTNALSVLSDSLFVIFENAWKHSGLGEAIGSLELRAEIDHANNLLTLRVSNALSGAVLRNLESGQLNALKEKYLSETTVERASREGGSGFAKLARMARYVERTHCPTPLDFGISTRRWLTVLTIPLIERGGVYETY